MNELSKYLCLLLRHQPDKAGLDMDEHGWVSVEQLIEGVNLHTISVILSSMYSEVGFSTFSGALVVV